MKKEKEIPTITKEEIETIMGKHTYIVYQQILVKKERTENCIKDYWCTIVRRVQAINEYEALGKFIVQTSNEYPDSYEKMTPQCNTLFGMKSIE